MSQIKIRGGILSLAAVMEKRMKERIDKRFDVNRANDTRLLRKGFENEAKKFLKLVRSYELDASPDVDIQKIFHKGADVAVMATLIVQVLSAQADRER